MSELAHNAKSLRFELFSPIPKTANENNIILLEHLVQKFLRTEMPKHNACYKGRKVPLGLAGAH